ncbi:hypothetical protein DIPPA_53277 [Diplonema papillatum]|nr:hypothetical protein DIPPA_53277 [Diplonema papillatum]
MAVRFANLVQYGLIDELRFEQAVAYPSFEACESRIAKKHTPYVLVVADNPFRLVAYKVWLEKMGCKVACVRDPRQAYITFHEILDNPAKHRPECTFVDLSSRKQEGIELVDFIQYIRSSEREVADKIGQHVHNVVIAVLASRDRAAEMLQRGYDHFLRSPFVLSLGTIRRLLLPSIYYDKHRSNLGRSQANYHLIETTLQPLLHDSHLKLEEATIEAEGSTDEGQRKIVSCLLVEVNELKKLLKLKANETEALRNRYEMADPDHLALQLKTTTAELIRFRTMYQHRVDELVREKIKQSKLPKGAGKEPSLQEQLDIIKDENLSLRDTVASLESTNEYLSAEVRMLLTEKGAKPKKTHAFSLEETIKNLPPTGVHLSTQTEGRTAAWFNVDVLIAEDSSADLLPAVSKSIHTITSSKLCANDGDDGHDLSCKSKKSGAAKGGAKTLLSDPPVDETNSEASPKSKKAAGKPSSTAPSVLPKPPFLACVSLSPEIEVLHTSWEGGLEASVKALQDLVANLMTGINLRPETDINNDSSVPKTTEETTLRNHPNMTSSTQLALLLQEAMFAVGLMGKPWLDVALEHAYAASSQKAGKGGKTVKKKNDAQHQATAKLHAELAEFEKKLESAEAEHKRLTKDLESELALVEAKLDTLKEQFDVKQGQVEALLVKDAERIELEERVNNLEKTRVSDQETWEALVSNLNVRLSSASAELKRIKDDHALKTTLSQCSASDAQLVVKLKAKLAEADAEHDALSSSLSEARAEIDSLQAQLDASPAPDIAQTVAAMVRKIRDNKREANRKRAAAIRKLELSPEAIERWKAGNQSFSIPPLTEGVGNDAETDGELDNELENQRIVSPPDADTLISKHKNELSAAGDEDNPSGCHQDDLIEVTEQSSEPPNWLQHAAKIAEKEESEVCRVRLQDPFYAWVNAGAANLFGDSIFEAKDTTQDHGKEPPIADETEGAGEHAERDDSEQKARLAWPIVDADAALAVCEKLFSVVRKLTLDADIRSSSLQRVADEQRSELKLVKSLLNATNSASENRADVNIPVFECEVCASGKHEEVEVQALGLHGELFSLMDELKSNLQLQNLQLPDDPCRAGGAEETSLDLLISTLACDRKMVLLLVDYLVSVRHSNEKRSKLVQDTFKAGLVAHHLSEFQKTEACANDPAVAAFVNKQVEKKKETLKQVREQRTVLRKERKEGRQAVRVNAEHSRMLKRAEAAAEKDALMEKLGKIRREEQLKTLIGNAAHAEPDPVTARAFGQAFADLPRPDAGLSSKRSLAPSLSTTATRNEVRSPSPRPLHPTRANTFNQQSTPLQGGSVAAPSAPVSKRIKPRALLSTASPSASSLHPGATPEFLGNTYAPKAEILQPTPSLSAPITECLPVKQPLLPEPVDHLAEPGEPHRVSPKSSRQEASEPYPVTASEESSVGASEHREQCTVQEANEGHSAEQTAPHHAGVTTGIVSHQEHANPEKKHSAKRQTSASKVAPETFSTSQLVPRKLKTASTHKSRRSSSAKFVGKVGHQKDVAQGNNSTTCTSDTPSDTEVADNMPLAEGDLAGSGSSKVKQTVKKLAPATSGDVTGTGTRSASGSMRTSRDRNDLPLDMKRFENQPEADETPEAREQALYQQLGAEDAAFCGGESERDALIIGATRDLPVRSDKHERSAHCQPCSALPCDSVQGIVNAAAIGDALPFSGDGAETSALQTVSVTGTSYSKLPSCTRQSNDPKHQYDTPLPDSFKDTEHGPQISPEMRQLPSPSGLDHTYPNDTRTSTFDEFEHDKSKPSPHEGVQPHSVALSLIVTPRQKDHGLGPNSVAPGILISPRKAGNGIVLGGTNIRDRRRISNIGLGRTSSAARFPVDNSDHLLLGVRGLGKGGEKAPSRDITTSQSESAPRGKKPRAANQESNMLRLQEGLDHAGRISRPSESTRRSTTRKAMLPALFVSPQLQQSGVKGTGESLANLPQSQNLNASSQIAANTSSIDTDKAHNHYVEVSTRYGFNSLGNKHPGTLAPLRNIPACATRDAVRINVNSNNPIISPQGVTSATDCRTTAPPDNFLPTISSAMRVPNALAAKNLRPAVISEQSAAAAQDPPQPLQYRSLNDATTRRVPSARTTSQRLKDNAASRQHAAQVASQVQMSNLSSGLASLAVSST